MPPNTPRMPTIYGKAIMNEKGQIVIPADARTALNLEAGVKFIVIQAPMDKGLLIVESSEVEKHMQNMMNILQSPDKESENI